MKRKTTDEVLNEVIERLTDEAEERSALSGPAEEYTAEKMREKMLGRLRILGVRKMDQQHANLVEIIVSLYELMMKMRTRRPNPEEEADIHKVLNELEEYTQVHFRDEEALMAEIAYPELDEHRLVHKKFIRKFLEIRGHIEAGNITYTVDLFFSVFGWLFDHINQVDAQYAHHLKKNQ